VSARAILVSLLLAAGTAVHAAPPACEGTLSGAVTARFACTVVLATQPDGATYLVIHGNAPIEGVPSYAPGAFEIPGPVAERTYTLDTLGMGRASVAAEGGTLYMASKTSAQRGEVTLVLLRVIKDPAAPGTFVAHGTYRARLLPVGAGKPGEVVVDVRF
jgi:hypothetical protein